MESSDIIIILVSIFGVIISLLSFQKSRFEVFNEFNKKYDELNEDLNLIRSNKEPKQGKIKEEVINDYLILCSEEFHWRWRFQISYKVWKNWRNGIEYFFQNENFHETIRTEYNKSKNSYYGFFDSKFFKSIDKKYKIIP